MGLFNHLFKPRHDEAGEKTVEDNRSAADGAPEKPAGTASPAAPGPATFLQPKGFIHRRPTPPPATTRIAPPLRPPVRGGTPPPLEQPGEIVLALGDILSHVPTQFLKTGMHDAKRELRFAAEDLTSDIARGRPAVALSRIAAQCPDVFHTDIAPADDLQIRLPLQKLLDQLGLHTARTVMPPAPAQSPAAPAAESTQPGGQLIHLSLAAILAQCPDALFAGERPRVDGSVRIGLPFAPIERQLVGGRVEISAVRFVALLPPALAPHFTARVGVRVPLPLEEIFRNLPGGPPPAPAAEPAPPIVQVKAELPPPASAPPEPEPPVVAELKIEAPAPAAEAGAPAPMAPLPPVRMPFRPPPVLGPAQAEPAAPAEEERPAEEIAAATAAVEVSHITAPAEPPAPAIEAPSPAPIPAAPSVSVPPMIRPRVILPPPVFASAPADPLREMPTLVPPPFVFTAPHSQTTEVKPEPPVFTAPPIPAPAAGRLDQDALQALFMTDETLDLPKLARLAAALPGVEACVITIRGDTVQYGHLPIEADTLADMVPQFPGLRALGPVACVTVNAAQHSVSFLTRADLCLCAIHGPRGFLPGVREKLTALADALAGT